MKGRALGCLVFLAVFLGAAVLSWAGKHEFFLINETGGPLQGFVVVNSADRNWEHELLKDSVLEDAHRARVAFTAPEGCVFDVRAKDENGNDLVWKKLNLCRVVELKLQRFNDDPAWEIQRR